MQMPEDQPSLSPPPTCTTYPCTLQLQWWHQHGHYQVTRPPQRLGKLHIVQWGSFPPPADFWRQTLPQPNGSHSQSWEKPTACQSYKLEMQLYKDENKRRQWGWCIQHKGERKTRHTALTDNKHAVLSQDCRTPPCRLGLPMLIAMGASASTA